MTDDATEGTPEQEPSRPLSVRSLMGKPAREADEAPSTEAPSPDEDDAEGGGRRPTPVRASLEELAPDTRSLQSPHIPARRFEIGGSEWIARLAGVTLYGTGSTPRAPVLSIRFFRGEEPEAPVKEIMAAGRSLDGWGDQELRDLFRRARPVRRKARREGGGGVERGHRQGRRR